MNKLIVLSLIIALIIVAGCGKKEATSTPTAAEKNTIDQANEAITNVDNTLVDVQDAETDKELDDIENTLNQI